MRRALLTLAALAIVGLVSGTALAGHGYRGTRGYRGPRGPQLYGSYYSYQAPAYGYYGPGAYEFFSRGYDGSSSPFLQALRRVQANHSRYRVNPHPRSYYKSPPLRYDYWGW